jgi:hypothetical protein
MALRISHGDDAGMPRNSDGYASAASIHLAADLEEVPHFLGPLDGHGARHKSTVRREQFALLEDLRLPAIALAVETQLALEQLANPCHADDRLSLRDGAGDRASRQAMPAFAYATCPVDFAHPAPAERSDNFVRAEPAAWRKTHCVGRERLEGL